MTRMLQQAFKQMTTAINNWPDADVQTVPGVMYQVRCGIDDNDPTIKYQLNYFIDSTETFIHNHRHSFDTLCLEGEYLETTWEVTDNDSGKAIYQFYRKTGNILDGPKEISGVLRPVRTRHHFPGNEMHLSINEYHSIAPVSSNTAVFTFLRKKEHTSTPNMYVLSPSPAIDAPRDEIRPATIDERQIMYKKLLHILQTKHPKPD